MSTWSCGYGIDRDFADRETKEPAVDNPRPEKVAVVEEVRERLDDVEAAILTEYRGLTVADLAELRRELAAVGTDYKVYKNTLVKRAVAGSRHDSLQPLLEGPTAIAFVSGEITVVAKALRDFAKAKPALIIKGGMIGDGLLSDVDLTALADLPPREMLLSQLAGLIAQPMRQMAGLLQALPRNMAYGLKALIDERGGPEVAASAESSPSATGEVEPEEQPTAESTVGTLADPIEDPLSDSPEVAVEAPPVVAAIGGADDADVGDVHDAAVGDVQDNATD